MQGQTALPTIKTPSGRSRAITNACPFSAQLPAGISYEDCPNYPHCAVNRAIVPLPAAVAAGPADVAIERCAAYPFCDNAAAHNANVAGGNGGFPAGVDPTSCPGYPFHQCKLL